MPSNADDLHRKILQCNASRVATTLLSGVRAVTNSDINTMCLCIILVLQEALSSCSRTSLCRKHCLRNCKYELTPSNDTGLSNNGSRNGNSRCQLRGHNSSSWRIPALERMRHKLNEDLLTTIHASPSWFQVHLGHLSCQQIL